MNEFNIKSVVPIADNYLKYLLSMSICHCSDQICSDRCEIKTESLSALTYLSSSNQHLGGEIQILDGLQYCDHLTNLNLNNQSISTISDIATLGLTTLYLNNNNITSINGVSLPVTKLYLNNNLLTSLNGVTLPSLSELYAHNNLITSLEGLSFSSKSYLHLMNNNISSEIGRAHV